MLKKHVEVVKSMFMVYKFFIVFLEGKESEIISFALNFAGHETMIKMQGNFVFITTDNHIMN